MHLKTNQNKKREKFFFKLLKTVKNVNTKVSKKSAGFLQKKNILSTTYFRNAQGIELKQVEHAKLKIYIPNCDFDFMFSLKKYISLCYIVSLNFF